jgi:phosphoglycolate phosphatase
LVALAKIVYSGRRAMCDSIDAIEPCEDLPRIIRRLYDDGHKLFIVSSNSVHNIELFLTWHALNIEFVKIYGNVGWRGKTHVLKKACRHNKLAKADTFYVGDETRDIRSAKRAGIGSVAVSWGYNTVPVLKSYHPNYLIEHPSKLMEIFSKSTPSCYNKLDEQLEAAEPALSTWPDGRV